MRNMSRLPEETRQKLRKYYEGLSKPRPATKEKTFFCGYNFLENYFEALGVEITQEFLDRHVRRLECGWLAVKTNGWKD